MPAHIYSRIPAADRWGPFADGLDTAEQRARLRALRALARVLCGPRGTELCRLLALAEDEPTALAPAVAALNDLPATDRRNLLASYAGMARAA